MKPERILLPIDIAKCPIEVFSLVNTFAKRPGVTLTLLHVVNLNIVAPENRVYEELGHESYCHLDRLAREYVDPLVSIRIRIRAGKPAEEIMAEAKEANADLIILPMHRRSPWRRLLALFLPKIVKTVIQDAPCAVFVLDVKTRFNCEKQWGREMSEIGAALDYLDETSGMNPLDAEKDSLITTQQEHRIAA